MRSNAGMADRQRDVDLRFTQVSALRTLACLVLSITSTFYAYKDGTASKFRNVDTKISDAGRLPKRHNKKHNTAFNTRRKFEIKMNLMSLIEEHRFGFGGCF
jgi:hypothetical protein